MGLMHAFVSPHQKKLKDLKTHEKLKISHLEAKFTIYKKNLKTQEKNSRFWQIHLVNFSNIGRKKPGLMICLKTRQICEFRAGSYAYNDSSVMFYTRDIIYSGSKSKEQATGLHYTVVAVRPLR